MIKEKELTIKVTSKEYEYYSSKGYYIPKVLNDRKKLVVPKGTTILVKIEDILHGSHENVTILCDLCNSVIKTTPYYNYIECDHKNREHICTDCKDNIKKDNKIKKAIIKENKKEKIINKEFKICCKCKKELPATTKYFHRNKYNLDGLTYDCKECRNEFKKVIYNHNDVGKEIDYTDNYKHGIYNILNTKNNKIYIGSAVNLYRRMYNHIFQLKNGIHHSKHLQRSWDKYGSEFFKFYIIEYVEDKNKLIEREQYWLDYYQSYEIDIGYNIRHIADSNIGKKLTEETKMKISEAGKGRKLSEESRRKISEKNRGKEGVGKKKIVQIDTLGNLIKIWDCISLVEKEGYNNSCVGQCCMGNRELSGGYFWFYYDDYIKEDFYLPELKNSINKRILQFDLEGNLIKEWENAKECRDNNYNSNQILSCCNSVIKTHNRFIWLFKDDYNNDLDLSKYKKKIGKRITKVNTYSKWLLQFDLNGNLINEWFGIEQARKSLNLKSVRVIDIKNNRIICNDYIWIYKDDYYSDPEKYNKYFKTPILQFSLSGNFIKEWDAPSSITRELNLNNRPITQCCNNKDSANSAYGFLWRYKVENDDYTIDSNKDYKYKKVLFQYQLIDNTIVLLKKWNNIYSASKELNIDRAGLTRNINSGKEYKGYLWSLDIIDNIKLLKEVG